jgi:hypothetical protein
MIMFIACGSAVLNFNSKETVPGFTVSAAPPIFWSGHKFQTRKNCP